ncbi:hypothetical protein K7X08_019361 [Anisodus acutangulus]|uniref:Protein kinase domain-containing protein n=1 Tax=Anisodus acutangulus TaxID=402998 RepID=A0A9Q1MV27_9SOLA|nr:hypothetical protein K7X08_019361 [Anisodus acutangulus]
MANYSQSLDWEFPLYSGFFYLFRLHFCEIQLEVEKQNYRVFDISIGNQTADQQVDVIQRSGGWRIPMYKDYVVNVRDPDGRRSIQNVSLDLRPNMETKAVYANAILNGLEIFKLNDSNGNLSVPNPESRIEVPTNSPQNNKKKKTSHIIVVIIAGVISVIVLFSILCFFILRRRKSSAKDSGPSVTNSSWVQLSTTSDSTQRTAGSVSSSLPSDLCRHFLLEEIKAATGNFDDNFLIGKGGFGNVYKGNIDNGATIVAVKRLNPSSKQGVREFETEILMLSKLRHLHLVSLIGYCDNNNEMILVYDYMAHGTLRDHLYKTENVPLPWRKRLEICIGAAKGLHYLHTGTKHTIIHRDVKSTNILLDDKWVAKVSDFGLSKVGPLGGTENTHVSTAVKGSFGCCKKGNLEQIIDPRLEGQIAPECLNKFAEAAYNCLRDQGIQRPSMGDVVWSLEFALKLQDAANNRGHKAEENSYSTSPSFPSILNGHTNISTDEVEVFSASYEAGGKTTSSVAASTDSSKALRKEYVINVDETQILNITFSPSPNSYAFVNGIEIVSMPTDLYVREYHRIKLVGQNDFYYIDNNIALENVYRLNVGGNFVPSTGDTGMYREWALDDEFVVGLGFQTTYHDVNISYTYENQPYTAPTSIYTTSRTMANYSQSLDWKFPLDSGFVYLFRLHFCETHLEVNERVFDIFIANQTADQQVDVIQRSGSSRVPMYKDYVVYVRDPDGRRSIQNVLLDLRPNMETKAVYANAILNGLEIFKLSDSNGNLAVPCPGPIKSPPNNKKKRLLWHIIVVILKK